MLKPVNLRSCRYSAWCWTCSRIRLQQNSITVLTLLWPRPQPPTHIATSTSVMSRIYTSLRVQFACVPTMPLCWMETEGWSNYGCKRIYELYPQKKTCCHFLISLFFLQNYIYKSNSVKMYFTKLSNTVIALNFSCIINFCLYHINFVNIW